MRDVPALAPSDDADDATHGDILRAVRELSARVGWYDRDDKGELIGRGLAGDLARLQARVDERLTWFAGVRMAVIAVGATTTVFGGVIWFLAREDLARVFHAPPPSVEAKP